MDWTERKQLEENIREGILNSSTQLRKEADRLAMLSVSSMRITSIVDEYEAMVTGIPSVIRSQTPSMWLREMLISYMEEDKKEES